MLTFTPNGEYVLVANEGGAERLRRRARRSARARSASFPIPKSHSQLKKLKDARRAHGVVHEVQRPGSEPARAGHPHLRSGRERCAGLRAGVHRGLRGFAHGLRDAAGEQCDRGDRHQERAGDGAAAARLQGLQRAAADHRDVRVERPAGHRRDRRGPEAAARRFLRARVRRRDRATASSSSSRTPIAARTASRPASIARSCCRASIRASCASRSIRRTASSSSPSRSRCGARTARC